MNATAYIDPPRRIPIVLRLGIWIAERKVGKVLLPPRLLAWYPRAAIGAGVMEGLVAHEDGRATARLLKLVRMQVSFMSACPFCIDLNSAEFANAGISQQELECLRDQSPLEHLETLAPAERLALQYARALTGTPARADGSLIAELRAAFSERELVVIASTIAQVNFWTRFNVGLGVPPAGVSDVCAMPDSKET